jgi:5-methylcytosine-specific restriction enzyme subunit McrC
MRRTLQVYEFQKVTLKSGRYPLKGFNEPLLKSFQSYHQQNDETPFFKLINNGVQFNSYVGAIRIGDTTVEVLPKADRSGREEDQKLWQEVLLDMLKSCHLLTAQQSSEANLKLKANSILELYFELFINELDQLIRQGLIKKYRKKVGNRNVLKGALQFSDHIRKNVVHKEKFYVRYTTYDQNHQLHQILHEALLLVQQFNSSPLLQDRIGRILLNYPEVSRLKVNAASLQRIRPNRKNAPYQLALQIAELILLNYRPDIQSGQRNLIALMFDMNVLWEEYVYQLLKKYRPPGYEVHGQSSKKFWYGIRVRPDVVIKNPDGESFVIDTKWKIVESNKPSVQDLRQMFTYNHMWGAEKSMLLYPGVGKEESEFRRYTPSVFTNEEDKHSCRVGFIDVLRYHALKDGKKQFAEAIFEKLN